MKRNRLVLVIAFLAMGCEPEYTTCDDISNEVRALLEACGIGLGDFDRGPVEECTQSAIERENCVLDCYKAGDCAAYVSVEGDEEGFLALNVCVSECVANHPWDNP